MKLGFPLLAITVEQLTYLPEKFFFPNTPSFSKAKVLELKNNIKVQIEKYLLSFF